MGVPDRRAAAAAIEAFLRAIGRDPDAEPELARTGERVATAYIDELCDGYAVDVAALLAAEAIPDARASGSTEFVALHDITFTTVCPHHLMPATGSASVAFAPGAALVGLGTLVKLVDALAHRLTLQEDIGRGVSEALVTHLGARWAACRITLAHACVSAQGPRRAGTRAETLAFAGDPACRAIARGSVSGGASGAP
jgi:GTP cyclohydrolase I